MNLENAFFISSQNISKEKFVLNKSESNHAIRVLRLKKNQKLFLIDGKGIGYKAVIDNIDYDKVSGTITSKLVGYGEDNFSINIGFGLIKRDKLKILIEKCTELGVDSFQPLLLDRNIKKKINIERCKKIILASSKQCHRSRFPEIYKPKNLNDLMKSVNAKIIAASMEANQSLSDIDFKKGKSLILIIGPEGDFSNKEIELLKENKVDMFNLGPRRLRSETAAFKAISILNNELS